MAYDERLADRVRSLLPRGTTGKKMFGGITFMLDGNMACGVLGDELIVRVGHDQQEAALRRKGARPFEGSGRPMKAWVSVESSALRSAKSLSSWVDQGIAFARSLPKK